MAQGGEQIADPTEDADPRMKCKRATAVEFRDWGRGPGGISIWERSSRSAHFASVWSSERVDGRDRAGFLLCAHAPLGIIRVPTRLCCNASSHAPYPQKGHTTPAVSPELTRAGQADGGPGPVPQASGPSWPGSEGWLVEVG